MSKTIAEMRASGQVRRRTEKHKICLNVELADQYRRLRDEILEAVAAMEAAGKRPTGPTRLGAKPKDQTAERANIDALSEQLDALAEEMAEFEVEMILEQTEPADWNEWAAAHPPREQAPDEAGRRALIVRDAQHGGRCDFDALVQAIPTWLTQLNDAPATKDDWAWIASVASPADLDDVADLVLDLHTGRVNLPKSLKTSLGTLLDGFGLKSPEPGESAPADSTAGSPSTRQPTSTTTQDD